MWSTQMNASRYSNDAKAQAELAAADTDDHDDDTTTSGTASGTTPEPHNSDNSASAEELIRSIKSRFLNPELFMDKPHMASGVFANKS